MRDQLSADVAAHLVGERRMSTHIDDRARIEDDTRARWWLWPRAREHHFRSICDGIPSFISLVSPAGEIQIANRPVLQYSGATREELYGRATTENIHPADLPNVMAAWAESLRTCQPYCIEARRRRADGAYRWFDMHGLPLEDERGQIACWFVLDRDIDDQRRAEALLAGEKRFLEMVASGSSMPAILHALCQLVENTIDDCHCSVLLVDSTGTRVATGAAPSLPPAYVAFLSDCDIKVTTGPCAAAACLNQQVISADIASETRWAAWCEAALTFEMRACWSTPISSTAGKVLGVFAISYEHPRTPTSADLSLIEQLKHIASIAIERTLNDAALRRSESFLAEAQRLSSTGSFSWRVATGEITWSEQLYRIFEFDQSSPVTLERIGSRVHPDDMPLLHDMVDRAQGEGSDFEYEHRLQLPDGSVKYLHLVAHGIRDQSGRLEYIGAAQDVTDQRLSEVALGKVRSELAHVSRITTLGAMTASIAHEVNQPLTAIIANATTGMRYLAAEPPNIGKAREAIQRTIHDGNHAADVISGLRALFRKQHATTASVDINTALEEVITLSRSELHNSRAIVRTELANDLPPVSGDRVQLQQVILNLLLNAAEAMSGVDDRPKYLTIRTAREHNEGVRVSVQDAGVGLEPQTASRLFDAFYTTKNSGMGIGLSVSRSIIERHGGQLWATANEGPGATFSFSIPQRVARVATPLPGADQPRTPMHNGLTVHSL